MMEVLNRNRRQEIEDKLQERFGIKIEIPHHIIQQSKEKARIFTGDLNVNDLIRLKSLLTIDAIGLYFVSFDMQDMRLGFDASMLYAKKARKNVIELDDEETKSWLRGKDIEHETKEQGFVIIRHNKDILGVARATGTMLLNFVPKERRLK